MSYRLALLALVSPVFLACGSSSDSSSSGSTGGVGANATGGAATGTGGAGSSLATGGMTGTGAGGVTGTSGSGGGTSVATGGGTGVATGGTIGVGTGGAVSNPVTGGASSVTTGGTSGGDPTLTGGASTGDASGGSGTTSDGGTSSTGAGGTGTVATGGAVGTETGGSTGTDTPSSEYSVGTGAFVTACGFTGYAWAGADETSSIDPESFSDVEAGGQLCASGAVAADPDYASYAMIGINIGQANTGEDDPPNAEIVPDGSGLYVSLANTGGSPIRIQIQDAQGDDSADHRWCATYTEPGVIPWDTFNTECWNDGGDFYAMEPINAVLVMIPGDDADETPFEVCVNSIYPEGSAACPGGSDTGTGGTSGTGGSTSTGGVENTGGSTETGGTQSTGGTGGGVVVDCDLPAAGSTGVAAPSGTPNGIDVLDWAGYKAAVSYSFDDANQSQLDHFDAMMALGVHFTFYLQTGKSSAADTKWGTAAEAGHELGNHTQSHQQNGTGTDVDAATTFIQSHFGVTPYTMAAPYGNSSYVSLAQSRFIINRGVAGGTIAPNSSSNAFDLPCNMPSSNAQATELNQTLASARSAGAWQIFTIHGFSGGSDGAYRAFGFDQFQAHVENTKSLGDVWIDSVVNVGAYWIAQKLLSSATPTTSGGESTWTWQLPDNFPPGMCLRVTTAGGTLKQDGQALAWDDHGYYQIALDSGSVTLAQ